MRSRRPRIEVLAVRRAAMVLACAAALAPTTSSAHQGTTGYSGKPYNGVSETCTTTCHAKGVTPPTLTVDVPATVQAGSTTPVTLVVAGTKVRTSMNAAFSTGVKTTKGSNTETPNPAQEPTEVGAVVPAPSGATGTYKFSFTAPPTNGVITLWVAGMAASGAGTAGDGVANTTRTILVTGGVDAGLDAGPIPDAGADAASDGGELPDAGSSSGEPRNPSSSAGTSARQSPPASDGCGAAGTRPSGGGAMGAVVLLLLVRLRRAPPRRPAKC